MFKHIKQDLPASIVVFFVAIPLCLGIALASGAPLFSGLIAGIIGGIVVGALSGSHIGVSGPAAGLAAIVLTAIGALGGWENFLVAVVLGGAIQILFGVLRAGIIGYYFPSSVIKGMLTGIGIIIVLKQIPHFFGYDSDPEGDFAFFQVDGENTFSEVFNALNNISPGATIIALIGLGILILWEKVLSKKAKIFQLIQGPLVAVVVGILFYVFTQGNELLAIAPEHLVSVPVPEDAASFVSQFSFPNFAVIGRPEIWVTAFTIALVASLETLLCVEATDKLDPEKRVTPTNRELLAQGTGNMLSGLVGGLPITQVIVRSSANIQSGGKTKLAAIMHGFFLLISVILIPTLLNMIPLSVLAAILFLVGYKLAKPSLFKEMYIKGWKQFVPFVVTVVGIIFTDLLIGIGLGLGVGIVVILIKSYQNSHFLHIQEKDNGKHRVKMTLAEEVTFINKGAILKELDSLPENTYLELDVRKTRYLDNDIIEILDDFALKAKNRNIDILLISERGEAHNPPSYLEFFNLRPKKTA
ncbi:MULTISPECIES: SulP family inorganic anion transporter [Robiginitalea]|uniref:Sulfate transporter n=1 Tax=Robiginitalea biformata (strain ATCC BAA-864 / DSM 15991 / KCTC 12146 / HTCC2501) TaxID=313596 RepID=A4CII8_ROBBH|nr:MULTISPECIES: SulP family inorganic anion transporter [Robiginitalea]EAR16746.1 Sulfate transporter [Robiginitalea biformata HTCC2501]MDC6353047.1 SulP family inorganic anion transporter [Robiginitalea sp. PM2]MDC6373786.1 SulP family inorganic anion transporter [Robiginitalea sp. SP8]